MKKLLILFLFISMPCFLFAQKDTIGLNIPLLNGKVIYESVVNVPGKTKIELYANARQWFIDYFKTYKDVIQNDDKDAGLIVGKGVLTFEYRSSWGKINEFDQITIQIECKDNKYRYRIYDQELRSPTSTDLNYYGTPENIIELINGKKKWGQDKSILRRELQGTDEIVKKVIASLINSMVLKHEDF